MVPPAAWFGRLGLSFSRRWYGRNVKRVLRECEGIVNRGLPVSASNLYQFAILQTKTIPAPRNLVTGKTDDPHQQGKQVA